MKSPKAQAAKVTISGSNKHLEVCAPSRIPLFHFTDCKEKNVE